MFENTITERVIGAAIEVHKELGRGLLESAYECALREEMELQGLRVRRVELGYRIDLLVEERVIVEIKAVDALHDVHLAQILTYLKFSGRRLGLLINFNVARLKDGIRRVIR